MSSGGLPRLPELGVDAEELIASSPHAVLLVTDAGRLVFANATAWQVLARVDGPPALGADLLAEVAPEHRERARRLLAGLATGGAEAGPLYLRLHGPPVRWVAVRGAAASGASGPQQLVQLAVVDVTEATRARQALLLSEARFRSAFQASSSGLAIVRVGGGVEQANDALARILDRPAQWFAGANLGEIVPPDERELDVEAVRRLRAGESSVQQLRRYLRPDGSLRHCQVTAVRLPADRGEELLHVQVEDVTERLLAETRLRHLALHDALTDLPGRGLVLHRLDQALIEARGVTAVLFVDLDGFKLINDALGHTAGDRVLVETGRRLAEQVRIGDTVGRFGGDEFLVVCPGLADREQGLLVARRIERAIRRPFPYDGDEVLVSASVGLAFAEPGQVVSAEDLIRDADTAMYRAKQLGKRRFEVFDQAMRERAAARARVEHLLARAVTEDRVLVEYQPVVDLPSRAVVGLEALLRIRDDDGTVLLPADFLEVAAEAGLLPALDDVVLDRAVRQAVRWRVETHRDLEIAVNLSSARVTRDLPDRVEQLLQDAGLPPDRLILEITEQVLVASSPTSEQAMQRLAELGVRLAIDDFGTGWASLTYLRRFPVSLVKVDRSFVAGLPDEPGDVVIVRAVIDLAKQLGLLCTVEGVETPEQYVQLCEMAPPFAQGYLFGAPVPAERVPDVLRADPTAG